MENLYINHEAHVPDVVIHASEIEQISRYFDYFNEFSQEELNEIVWEGVRIEIIFTQSNYLSREFRYRYRCQGGWTFKDLVTTICEKFNNMYHQEVVACGPSRVSRNGRRIPSNGPYGFTFFSPHNLGLDKIYISPTGRVRFETIH